MNIKKLIDDSPMSFLQYTTIFICAFMNLLDGMDVLVIAFSANAIAKEWNIPPDILGYVFSAAVVGMTIGALIIAPQADKIGRKKIMLGCATLMGIGIFCSAFSQSTIQLITLRFLSGLGIGGMLASTASLSSEYAPTRSKDFWVSFVVGAYAIGATLVGFLANWIIPEYGWRMLFKIAGILSLFAVPQIYFLCVESLDYLVTKKPKNALEKANSILTKMNLKTLTALPETAQQKTKTGIRSLFLGDFKRKTLTLWTSFFMAFGVLYFLVSWIPKLTSSAGMPEQLGYYSGAVFNLGSFIGILSLGGLALKIGLRKTICIFLSAAAVLMVTFQFFTGSAAVLVMFSLIGFAMQGGFIGLYPLATRLYPTEIRNTGVGWAIGAGRLGAVLGPLLAGYIIAAGVSMNMSFVIYAIPCLAAGLTVLLFKKADITES